jgi:Domain of unknown function (DUF4136)
LLDDASDGPEDLRNTGRSHTAPIHFLLLWLDTGLTIALIPTPEQRVNDWTERNRGMQTRLVTAGLIALFVPAAAMAQKVSYDYDKTANFATFKTYAHKDGTKVGQPLIDDRIVAAIDEQMAAKGFTKSEANPDVFVVYHVAFDKQKDISTFSSGYAGGYGPYGWGWGGGWGGGMATTSTQVRDIMIGTLVVDLADAKKGQLAWRGMGVKEVKTQASPEKRDKSINDAMKKIFKNYPPKSKT